MAQWQARCIIFEGVGGQTYPKAWRAKEKKGEKPFPKIFNILTIERFGEEWREWKGEEHNYLNLIY